MRKILIVVVMTGVACREPAPQTPVSNRAVEHRTPPAAGRLEVVEAQGTDPLRDLERTFGPVIASGTAAGQPWSLRGRIDARGAATFVQTGTGGGGGGGGALPFQDLGWKKLGHFGSIGSGEHTGIGIPHTLRVNGVVSKQIAAIDVRLANGTTLPAQIIDTGDQRANFFVVVWSVPFHWEVMIARDATGTELETYQRPTPAIPTPATASQGSTTRVTATRASATPAP
jgi:hypothetical protein